MGGEARGFGREVGIADEGWKWGDELERLVFSDQLSVLSCERREPVDPRLPFQTPGQEEHDGRGSKAGKEQSSQPSLVAACSILHNPHPDRADKTAEHG